MEKVTDLTAAAAFLNAGAAAYDGWYAYTVREGALSLVNCLHTNRTVTEIGGIGIENAVKAPFDKRTELTWLDLPDTVRVIGDSALSGCTGLVSLTIPASVTTLGTAAFAGCTSLTSVEFTSATRPRSRTPRR